jgi:hypothetical protein
MPLRAGPIGPGPLAKRLYARRPLLAGCAGMRERSDQRVKAGEGVGRSFRNPLQLTLGTGSFAAYAPHRRRSVSHGRRLPTTRRRLRLRKGYVKAAPEAMGEARRGQREDAGGAQGMKPTPPLHLYRPIKQASCYGPQNVSTGRVQEKSRVAILGGGIRGARLNEDQIVVSRRARAHTANE